MAWVEYDPQRRPPADVTCPRDTWERVKRERGWAQLPGETVAEMDNRLSTGLSPPPNQEPPQAIGPAAAKRGETNLIPGGA